MTTPANAGIGPRLASRAQRAFSHNRHAEDEGQPLDLVLPIRTVYVVSEAAPCSAIHRRMSSARQAVTRSDNLIGAGNRRAFTQRQSVDRETGISLSTWRWRR
jgi:hypothetical protein